jgi:hypothetical protein
MINKERRHSMNEAPNQHRHPTHEGTEKMQKRKQGQIKDDS